MNRIIIPVAAFLLLIVVACRKEPALVEGNTFVGIIAADSQLAAVACFPASDNQYIIFARANNFKTPGDIWGYATPSPGIIVKLDHHGNEIWRRPIDKANTGLWSAIKLRTGGYLTVGYSHPTSEYYSIIRYDENAHILSIDSLPLPSMFSWASAIDYAPANVIQLTNGNFAFVFNASVGFITVAGPDFSTQNIVKYDTPLAGTYVNAFHGLTQVNDSTIAINGFSYYEYSLYHDVANTYLLLTDLNGVMRSITIIGDSVQAESANFLGVNGKGLLTVSSTMNGITTREGTWVDYYNNTYAAKISGRINLVHYDSTGNFKSRKKVYSYPGYGMINTARPTSDGGYILVGTVNQSMHNTIDNQTMIYLLKLDSDYREQWSKVLNTAYASFGMDVFETSDGGYFVAGHHLTMNNRFNLLAIKCDANGNS